MVNKPTGITSHTLVQKVRRRLGISRIGHTGTLDPLASGLMILTIGKATKILPFMSHFFKEYEATMKLGLRSDTLDITGDILERRDDAAPQRETVERVLESFLGESSQLPPMYSAKKVNGMRLYDLARQNVEIDRKPQAITIKEIELLDIHYDEIRFRVVCSTGTYVRVLIEDIAERMGTIAVMTSLQRTAIDDFRLADAYDADEIDENVRIIPVYDVLKDYFYYEMADISDVMNGKKIVLPQGLPDTLMITHENEVIACYEKQDEYYRCKRGLW